MKRIDQLREQMKEENIDIYLVPTSDPHQSEYLSDHWKCREWLSGFTGSAGMLVVTMKNAGLWTDGRYFIQAEKELSAKDIELFKMGVRGVPTVEEYIGNYPLKNKRIGIFGELVSVNQYKYISQRIDEKNMITDLDLVGKIWKDRPEKPRSEVFIHDIEYTGESAESKLYRIRKTMNNMKDDYRVISSLDEIAWLFNLRGRDIKNNPVFLSYAVISEKDAILFTDAIVSKEIYDYADKQGFIIKSIGELEPHLKGIKSVTVGIDPDKTSIWIENMLEGCAITYSREILTYYESRRNSVQIENMRETFRKDGAALIKTFAWIRASLNGGSKVSEIDISDKLIEYRSEIDTFLEPSFDTIAAFREHGAMMHYCADEESNYDINGDGLLLIDSGGQYLSGTTDITRTIVIGEAEENQRKHYTLALKGMINLSDAKFLENTKGIALDMLAREFLWKNGIDYKSGTGHGVGYCLSVHMGDHRISPRAISSELKPGMVVTNEPGVYIEGEYGIRIENVLLVKEFAENESGRFLEFETLTLCPLEKELIDFEMLTEEEMNWIETYHNRIREELKDLLSKEELKEIW